VLVALGFVIGAVAGAKFLESLPVDMLRVAFGGLLLYLGLTFVLSGGGVHGHAALPAFLISVATTIAARFWRRRHPAMKKLAPPTADFEYHI
jgi:uncharacterized membrane protein YfcA